MARLDEATVTWRLFLCTFVVSIVLFAIGWFTYEPPAEKPLLNIVGGGFTVDHTKAEIRYDLSVKEVRPLRHGMIIEASFEDPAGNGYYVVRERAQRWRRQYSLRSPPVCGVRARKRYLVMLRVLSDRGDVELWHDVLYLTSHLGEDVMPEPPVTTWPGRNFSPNQ